MLPLAGHQIWILVDHDAARVVVDLRKHFLPLAPKQIPSSWRVRCHNYHIVSDAINASAAMKGGDGRVHFQVFALQKPLLQSPHAWIKSENVAARLIHANKGVAGPDEPKNHTSRCIVCLLICARQHPAQVQAVDSVGLMLMKVVALHIFQKGLIRKLLPEEHGEHQHSQVWHISYVLQDVPCPICRGHQEHVGAILIGGIVWHCLGRHAKSIDHFQKLRVVVWHHEPQRDIHCHPRKVLLQAN
mmetsp:Transcript_41949/g.99939  ORF Transcript_41949/g.99939 Transcript_41949/m.99939 type:complete len:244 (+) Transcript_41949:528-1259(+)